MIFKRAFLLLELVISLSVFIIFVLIFSQFINLAIKTRKLGQNKLIMLNEAIFLLESGHKSKNSRFVSKIKTNKIKLKDTRTLNVSSDDYFCFNKVTIKAGNNGKDGLKLELVGACFE